MSSFTEGLAQRHVLVLCDVGYAYACDALEARLRDAMNEEVMERVHVAKVSASGLNVAGQRVDMDKELLPVDDKFVIIFIGAEGPRLARCALRYNRSEMFLLDPSSGSVGLTLVTASSSKLLKRRYFLVQKARDASIFGILIGTMAVARYRDALEHVRSVIAARGKKCYSFIVGKINPAKLANFAEIAFLSLFRAQRMR